MIIILFLGVSLVTAIWYKFYERNWNKKVTGNLNFQQGYLYEGEQAKLIEVVENRNWMPLPVLEVSFHIRKEMIFHDMENTYISDYTYKRDVFSLLGNQRITRHLILNCTKRGYYQIDKVELSTYSLLYSQKYAVEKPVDVDIYVYAKRTDISDILITYEKMMGSLQCEKRLYDDPFAFRTIREYTTADPMKTINWKASAKTGELMVNTFDSTTMRSIMIYLDIEDSGILKYEHLIEESISIVASLAQKLLLKGMEVGLAINVYADENEAGIYLEPKSGKSQLTKIERLLAERRIGETIIEFPKILANVSKESFPIFISKNSIDKNRKSMEKFLDKEQTGIWILPISRNDECRIKSTNNLRLISREVSKS